MKSNIFPYALSILLAIKSINFLSKVICRSDKFFKIRANIRSSSGFSIFCNKKLFVLDLRSFKEKSILTIGFNEVTIMNLLSWSIILNKL